MRKLVVSAFVSLDGVVQAPGGPQEDESGGFRHGGWTVPYFDEAVGAFMGEFMGKEFDLVLGRRTYDIFAGYWPTTTEDAEVAKAFNDAVKHVASRSRPELAWERSQLLEGDVVEAVRALKETDGPELQVHGSGNLLHTLLPGGVVDELRLVTFPVVLGSGKRLFGDSGIAAAMRLVDHRAAATGVTMSVYEPDGELRTGSFG